MKKVLLLPVLLVFSACGPSEEEKKMLEVGRNLLEEGTRDTNLFLDRILSVHGEFLSLREKEDLPLFTQDKAGLQTIDPDSGEGNTLLVAYPDEKFKRTPSKYTFPRQYGYPEKYDPLIYWQETFLSSMLMHMETLREFMEDDTVDPYLIDEHTPLARILKNTHYLALLDGTYTEAKIFLNEEAGKQQYIPGTFSGYAYIFRIEEGAFLGRIPIAASNSNEIYYDLSRSPLHELQKDLRDKASRAAYTAMEEMGKSTETSPPPPENK